MKSISAVVLVSLALLLPGAATAQGTPALRERFTGTYAFAGGAREQAARDEAIGKAVESLFFLIRPIARSRLDAGKPVPAELRFSFSGGDISVTQTGRAPAVSPEDGSVRQLKGDIKVTQKFNAQGELTQSFDTAEGNRTNVYALAADGKTLEERVQVTSSKLPKPLRFSLTYRKP